MPLSRSRALSLPIVSISCNSLLGGVGDVADGHGKMNGQWRLHRQSLKRVDRLRVFTMPPIAPEPYIRDAPTLKKKRQPQRSEPGWRLRAPTGRASNEME